VDAGQGFWQGWAEPGMSFCKWIGRWECRVVACFLPEAQRGYPEVTIIMIVIGII
jgi:hypothetical protein